MKRFRKDGTPTNQFKAFMQGKYKAYMQSTKTSLFEVYGKPSEAKLRALDDIRSRADTAVYIISHNSQNFTVAYFIIDESLDCELFVVETKDNIYIISEVYL